MAKQNDIRNGHAPRTLAERLGTGPETAFEARREQGRALAYSAWAEEPAERTPEPDLRGAESVSALPPPGPAASLREGLAVAGERAQRIAEDIARLQSDIRLSLDAGPAEATAAARSSARRAVPRMSARLAAALLIVVVAALSWQVGLLSTGGGENLVLDSGFESSPVRWSPAGLQSDVSVARNLGVGGSAALEVRTRGSG